MQVFSSPVGTLLWMWAIDACAGEAYLFFKMKVGCTQQWQTHSYVTKYDHLPRALTMSRNCKKH